MLFLFSFQPPGKFLLQRRDRGPRGVRKMLVHAGLCKGEAHRRPRHQAVPPISHRLGLPSSCQVVTSGSLQAWSRCAAERWTGMRLWGKSSPSSCQRQLAACPLCLCRTDTLLLTGAAEGLQANAANICWGKAMSWDGAVGMLTFQLRRCKESIILVLLFRERGFLFCGGYLEFFGSCCWGHRVRKRFWEERTGFTVRGLECGAFLGRRIVTEEKGTELGEVLTNTAWQGRQP